MTQSVDDRVMMFIDLSNVSRNVWSRDMDGFRTDWFRLAKHLAGPRRLVGAFAVDTGPDPDNPGPKRRFHDHLRYTGFRIVTVPFRQEDRTVFGEVEVALTTELLSACYRDLFDVAIVVSGDRTLVPAVERVSREGKRIEVATSRDTFSGLYRKVADRIHILDDVPMLEFMPESHGDHLHDAAAGDADQADEPEPAPTNEEMIA